MPVRLLEAMQLLSKGLAQYQAGDYTGASSQAEVIARHLEGIQPHGSLQESQKDLTLFFTYHIPGKSQYLLGNYAESERAERAAAESRKKGTTDAVSDRRDLGELSTWLSMAVARQGRIAEAAGIIAPVVKFQRELAARNRGDVWQTVELAAALYAQSLTDKQQAPALLREAGAKIDSLPATMRPLHDVRLWRDLISEAQRSAG
jgi:hypothetical protein